SIENHVDNTLRQSKTEEDRRKFLTGEIPVGNLSANLSGHLGSKLCHRKGLASCQFVRLASGNRLHEDCGRGCCVVGARCRCEPPIVGASEQCTVLYGTAES